MLQVTQAVTGILVARALVGAVFSFLLSAVSDDDAVHVRGRSAPPAGHQVNTEISLEGANWIITNANGMSDDDAIHVRGRSAPPAGHRVNTEISLEGANWIVSNANGSIQIQNAVVPGNVHTALLKDGIISDPYYGYNDLLQKWVVWDNWTYATSFEATADLVSKPSIRLVCEGIDTVATVYVNDQIVGSARNQFVRYVYDITSAVQVGTNNVRFEFTSATEYAKYQFDNHGYRIPPDCPPPEYQPECHANMIRKAQCSFSWDWGPSFPTQGIWRPIWVEGNDEIKIRDIIPHIADGPSDDWLMNLTIHTDVVLDTFAGNIRVDIPELGVSFEQNDITITKADGSLNFPDLSIPKAIAEAWWPYGYGNQKLYNLVVTLSNPSLLEVDSKTVRTGFRVIESVEDAISTGLTFYFVINGVAIYMKGSNWIPVDSFYDRVTEERHRRLLESGTLVNMNTIRVWGGGIYEQDSFYDIADELGLLIWQDHMFACNMYPRDQDFLDNVRQEITYQTRRLAYHPSVAAWSGNNENEGALVDDWYGTAGPLYETYKDDYIALYIGVVRDAIIKEDYTRPFLPSSPTNGRVTEGNGWISEDPKPSSPDYGDIHYYNYVDDCLDPTIYLPTRYASEYGYQSWPSWNTVSKVAEPADLQWGSAWAVHRQHHPGASNGTEQNIRRHFNWPDSGDALADFPNIIYLFQTMQALCYKVQTEYYRRGQSEPDIRNMGALYWQHNDIWQAPSWATIDFDGNWKMAHYYAAHFFADPILSSVNEAGMLHVYTVTDKLVGMTDIQLVIELWTWGARPGSPLYTWNIPTEVPPASSTLAYGQLEDNLLTEGGCPQREECFFTMYLQTTNDVRISPVNPHYTTPWRSAVGMLPSGVQINGVGEVSPREFNIFLSIENIAAFVWLEAADIPGWFSDNGFLWTDTPTMTLKLYTWEDATVADVIAALTVKTLADIY